MSFFHYEASIFQKWQNIVPDTNTRRYISIPVSEKYRTINNDRYVSDTSLICVSEKYRPIKILNLLLEKVFAQNQQVCLEFIVVLNHLIVIKYMLIYFDSSYIINYQQNKKAATL
jgi:hypothetical protein